MILIYVVAQITDSLNYTSIKNLIIIAQSTNNIDLRERIENTTLRRAKNTRKYIMSSPKLS